SSSYAVDSSLSSHSRQQHDESSGGQQRKRARVADDDDADSAPPGAMAGSLDHLRAIRASIAEMVRTQAEMVRTQAEMARNQVALAAIIRENTTMTNFVRMSRAPDLSGPARLVRKTDPAAGPSSSKPSKPKKTRDEGHDDKGGHDK
ncbi:hypothetical protein BGX31_004870, partial [Mortierella sp. GBA43]